MSIKKLQLVRDVLKQRIRSPLAASASCGLHGCLQTLGVEEAGPEKKILLHEPHFR